MLSFYTPEAYLLPTYYMLYGSMFRDFELAGGQKLAGAARNISRCLP
jgi:hypothetical protein